MPARIAAAVGSSPAAPTMAATTIWTPEAVATAQSPSEPPSSSTSTPTSSSFKRGISAGSATAASFGLNWRICRASSSRFFAPESARTRNLSGWAATISRVLTPMEPVDPRIEMCFISEPPEEVYGIVVGYRSSKKDTIHPVQHATVAGEDAAGVFDPEAALQ